MTNSDWENNTVAGEKVAPSFIREEVGVKPPMATSQTVYALDGTNHKPA